MTTGEIDDLLFRLLGRVNGDARHLGFVEPAVLIYASCLEEHRSEMCDQHIRPHAHSMINALRPGIIPSLGYRVLRALPAVLERIAVSAPEAIPPDFARVNEAISRALEWHHLLLGEDTKHADAPERADLSRSLALQGTEPQIDLAMVWNWQPAGNDFNIGKTIKTGLNLVIAGEWSLTRTFEPLVAFTGRIREHDDPFALQLHTAVSVAERYLLRRGVGEIRSLPREYIYRICAEESPPDWLKLFTGGSAGLGLTLLTLATLDTLDLRRRQRVLRGDVVITGEIDAEGNVHAVDGAGIAPKIEAAFHSPCRTFVLPRGNLEAAGEALDRLSQKHPHRTLDLFPVTTVSEAYEDPSVTAPREVPRLKVTAARAGRRRKTLAVGITALAAAVMMGFFLPPRLDREIVTYDFDGGKIRFFNRYGYNFAAFTVPYYIEFRDNTYHDIGTKSHRLIFDDINGDPATRELVFISVESRWGLALPMGRIHVHLFSSKGELLRHVETMPEITIMSQDSIRVITDFGYVYDIVEDLDGDGFKDILIGFVEHPYWASGIINISLLRGDYQCFLHRGHMGLFITGDFNADGRKEIVVGGKNNHDTTAVVAVLDPERMHGMTPPPEWFGMEIPDFEDNVCMYYIALPVSDLREVRRGIKKPVLEKVVSDDTGRVWIRALENGDVPPDNMIFYYLDSNWRCVEIVYSDDYKEAFKLGDLGGMSFESRLEKQTARMMREFRYFDGSGYTNSPVINSGYLAGNTPAELKQTDHISTE